MKHYTEMTPLEYYRLKRSRGFSRYASFVLTSALFGSARMTHSARMHMLDRWKNENQRKSGFRKFH
jgi:hypothetical protein